MTANGAICPDCGRIKAVTRKGKIVRHTAPDSATGITRTAICKGSGKRAK